MNYTVEKDIPIPRRKQGGKAILTYPVYPFNSMELGDSFFVPNYSRDKMQRLTIAGRSYFKKMNKKLTVTTRKQDEGFRVWVVKSRYYNSGRKND